MYDMGIMADQGGYVYLFLQISYSVFGFSGGIMETFVVKRTLIISGYIAGFFGF